jgi:hypothetical protein
MLFGLPLHPGTIEGADLRQNVTGGDQEWRMYCVQMGDCPCDFMQSMRPLSPLYPSSTVGPAPAVLYHPPRRQSHVATRAPGARAPREVRGSGSCGLEQCLASNGGRYPSTVQLTNPRQAAHGTRGAGVPGTPRPERHTCTYLGRDATRLCALAATGTGSGYIASRCCLPGECSGRCPLGRHCQRVTSIRAAGGSNANALRQSPLPSQGGGRGTIV